jgi:hypothetical protein
MVAINSGRTNGSNCLVSNVNMTVRSCKTENLEAEEGKEMKGKKSVSE